MTATATKSTVTVPTKPLSRALKDVSRIAPKKSSNPLLTTALLELKNGKLVFSATNLDVSLELTLACDVAGEGLYALPAAQFSTLVNSAPNEVTELVFGEHSVKLSSGSFNAELQLVDPANVHRPEFADAYDFSGPGPVLARLVDNVEYATAVAEYQAIFRGVHFDVQNGRLRCVATDGFRLALMDSEIVFGGDAFTLPSKSAAELPRLLGDEPVEFKVSAGQLFLRSGGMRLALALMEGNFPDYRRVIPTVYPLVMTVDAERLRGVVDRVVVMADLTANKLTVFDMKRGRLTLSAQGSYGRSEEALEVELSGSQSELVASFNASYVLDALAKLSGSTEVRFSGSATPCLFASADEAQPTAMVVPLRL